ncbi:MAG: response regulator [Acidobacteria bacterium]|nr:response regulator [Acidobacteriota bacterium]
MRRMLSLALAGTPEFRVVGEAGDGEEALGMVGIARPDVTLVDLSMPRLDGIGMIRALRATGVRTSLLVLTSNGDRTAVATALEAGADGYVLKGCSVGELRSAVLAVGRGGSALAPAVARSLVDDYTRMLEERRERDLAVIRTLASAVEMRDRGTGNHAQNVARLALTLWRSMIGTDPEDLVYGFLLHDVGKIGIPDAILLKEGPLEPGEMEVIRGHVRIGAELVSPLGFRPEVISVIRCHHERWDGRGYPAALRGDEIPLAARVFGVVDAFDAMTSDRPYRRAVPVADALAELERHAGTQFDPTCTAGFTRLAGDMGLG